jgi:hypothetical protein
MAFGPQRPAEIDGRASGGGGVEECGLGADEAAGCVTAAFEID